MPERPAAKHGQADSSFPLVSILIPCYNAERWVKQSIQSALDQDYPNKEVIVVDDGSGDASVKIVTSFGDSIVFDQLPHSGGNAARNRLTELARGEWLQYLDSDDFLLPGKISSQLASIDQPGSPVDVIYSPVIIHNTERPDADYVLEIKEDDITLTFIRWGAINTNGLLFRRSAVLGVGGWREDQPCCQEHELLLRLIQAGRRFRFDNAAASVYRTHSLSTVSRRNPLQVIQVRMGLTDRMVEYLESAGRMTFAHREALYIARMESARSAVSIDASLAEQLASIAAASLRPWVRKSPALPLSYQLALRVLGFRRAERLASLLRRPPRRERPSATDVPLVATIAGQTTDNDQSRRGHGIS